MHHCDRLAGPEYQKARCHGNAEGGQASVEPGEGGPAPTNGND